MPADPSFPALLPEVLNERIDDADRLTVELRIPDSLAYFPGHFPGTPIVPGVVQIQWAVHFARERLAVKPCFHHLEGIKFKDLVRPGQRLHLNLHYHTGEGKLQFAFRAANLEYSSGRIYFHGNRL